MLKAQIRKCWYGLNETKPLNHHHTPLGSISRSCSASHSRSSFTAFLSLCFFFFSFCFRRIVFFVSSVLLVLLHSSLLSRHKFMWLISFWFFCCPPPRCSLLPVQRMYRLFRSFRMFRTVVLSVGAHLHGIHGTNLCTVIWGLTMFYNRSTLWWEYNIVNSFGITENVCARLWRCRPHRHRFTANIFLFFEHFNYPLAMNFIYTYKYKYMCSRNEIIPNWFYWNELNGGFPFQLLSQPSLAHGVRQRFFFKCQAVQTALSYLAFNLFYCIIYHRSNIMYIHIILGFDVWTSGRGVWKWTRENGRRILVNIIYPYLHRTRLRHDATTGEIMMGDVEQFLGKTLLIAHDVYLEIICSHIVFFHSIGAEPILMGTISQPLQINR